MACVVGESNVYHMTLTHTGARFEFQSGYDNRHIPKAAGFLWDGCKKVWQTKFRDVASKLAQYADDPAKTALAPAPQPKGEIPAPDGLKYLPFQKDDAWFMYENKWVMNGNDMGTGKTVEIMGLINLLNHLNEPVESICVVCPAISRVSPWQRHFEDWSIREYKVGVVRSSDWPQDAEVVIISFNMLERHLERLNAKTWDILVVDEAHFLANPKAKRTRYVAGGKWKDNSGFWRSTPGIQAHRRIWASGTFMRNRPRDLWVPLSKLDPERWRSWKYFATRYCAAFQQRVWVRDKLGQPHQKMVWDTTGASNLEELGRILRTIMIRRTKEEVLPELPPKRRQIIELPANGNTKLVQSELEAYEHHEETVQTIRRLAADALLAHDDTSYRELVEELRHAREVAFTDMSKRRHEVALAKLPQLIAHIQNCLENVDKLVVFAWHKDVVAGIGNEFDPEIVVTLTGDTTETKREEAIEGFRNDPNCRLFLGNILAAGVSCDLTAASHVIFAELDWVPANINQAEDRCHRYGQTESVLVQHTVLEGSLDVKQAKTLIGKQEIINQTMDEPPELEPLPLPTPEELDSIEVKREQHPELTNGLQFLAERTFAGLDGQGFNRHDAVIGAKLGALKTFTPRQAAFAQKLCHKYRRQLEGVIACN